MVTENRCLVFIARVEDVESSLGGCRSALNGDYFDCYGVCSWSSYAIVPLTTVCTSNASPAQVTVSGRRTTPRMRAILERGVSTFTERLGCFWRSLAAGSTFGGVSACWTTCSGTNGGAVWLWCRRVASGPCDWRVAFEVWAKIHWQRFHIRSGCVLAPSVDFASRNVCVHCACGSKGVTRWRACLDYQLQ